MAISWQFRDVRGCYMVFLAFFQLAPQTCPVTTKRGSHVSPHFSKNFLPGLLWDSFTRSCYHTWHYVKLSYKSGYLVVVTGFTWQLRRSTSFHVFPQAILEGKIDISKILKFCQVISHIHCLENVPFHGSP